MANPYYTNSSNPATGSSGSSVVIRSEFASISAGFNLLPTLTGQNNQAVVVNSSGTALVTTTGTLALAGNFATTGAFAVTLAASAAVTLTLPAVSGTLATLAGAETLTNKTLVAPVLGAATATSINGTTIPSSATLIVSGGALGTPSSGVATNLTGTAASLSIGGTATTATNIAGGLGGSIPYQSAVNTTALLANGSSRQLLVSAGGTSAPAWTTETYAVPGTSGNVMTSNGTNWTSAAPAAAAAGSLTGATLASGVTASSLTSFGAAIALGTPASGVMTNVTGTATALNIGGNAATATTATNQSGGTVSATTGSFSSTVSGAGITSLFASPPAIGGTAPAAGAFTTLSATGAVSGAGVTARFATPGPIGNTSASTGAFTTLSASSLLTPTGGIKGISTNTDAAAGSVGEYTSSTVLVGSSVALANNTATDITTISLTAGDWEVSGGFILNPAGSTLLTSFFGWINTASATLPTRPNGGGYAAWAGSVSASVIGLHAGMRLSLPGTTTVYLTCLANWTTAQPGGYGFIGARRAQPGA